MSPQPGTQPSRAQQAFGTEAPKLAELTDHVLFGDIWQRSALPPRDRSLITVAALVALGWTEQLPFHLGFALENGVSREELAELITHLAFYAGWPAAAAGVARLQALSTEEA